MKLLTQEIIDRFAKVGSQENVKDPIAIVKFFNPTGAGSWFATEMCFNITYAKDAKTQMPELSKDINASKFKELQGVLKQDNSKNEKKRRLISDRREESSFQEWDKNGQRICNDVRSKSSISSEKICKEGNFGNGENVKSISGNQRNSTSQKSNSGGRQDREFGVDDKNSTSVISHEATEFETLDINASELKNYPNAKINSTIFFGYVSLFGDWNDEWGSFSLEELENFKGLFGLGIERDRGFSERPMSEVIKQYTHNE